MTKPLAPAMMAVAIVLGCLASAHATDLLILRSTVADMLPEGGIIDGTKPLSLPAGAAVTLVGESGNKITLKGPYSGVPGAAEQSAEGGFGSRMLMALSRLIVGTPRDASRLGATRGAAGAMSDDLWLINVSMSGDHCLMSDSPAALWRARADNTAPLSIKRYRTKDWVRTEWQAGEETIGWPSDMEVIDDATYLVRVGSGIAVSKVVLHLVPGDLPSDFHRAAWMTEKGCLRQARSLLSRLQ